MSYAERTLSVSVSGAPSWWTDPSYADRTWTKVCAGAGAANAYQQGSRPMDAWQATDLLSGSAADIDGQRPNRYAYSGGCVDQARGEFWIHGGGHNAYPGNEPAVCGLRDAVPAWRSLGAPSPGSYTRGNSYQGNNGAGQYDADYGINGAPVSSHTYNRLIFAHDRMIVPGLTGMQDPMSGANRDTSKVFYFDRQALRWSAGPYMASAAEYALMGGFPFQVTSCVYIPQDDVIWVNNGGPASAGGIKLLKLDGKLLCVLATYTDAQTDGWWTTGNTLIPGTRYILCRGTIGSTTGLHIWDAANPTASYRPTALSVSGVSGWASMEYGAAWHAASNSLLVGSGQSENFVKLTPNSPTAYTGAWTATTITPANSADPSRVQPTSRYTYTYGRWNIINDMGNGQSALIFHADGPSTPVYVFKLPASGLN